MTTRAAILIESSDIKNEQDLPGARKDIENWKNFLISNQGGAWEYSEISVLHRPTLVQLKSILNSHRYKDYVFIAFSGHGYHIQNADIDETKICLNETEEPSVFSINPANDRCTFIIDACRGIINEQELRKSLFAEEMINKLSLSRIVYRELFDKSVMRAEKGIIRLYSCSINESASESPLGGTYSKFLIEVAQNWHEKTTHGDGNLLLLNRAHDLAAKLTTKKTPQQHPEYQGGRRLFHFPIAVCP